MYLPVGNEKLYSLELGDLVDTAEGWVPVLHFEALTLEGVGLHALVVIGAHSVKIFSLGQLLELLWGLVEIEEFFNAVIMVTNVVAVLENSKSSVDLILKSEVHFF